MGEGMTLLTAQDLAEMWKVELRYVRDRIAKRKDFPKARRVGKYLRWSKEECDKWLEKQKV